MTLQWQNIPSVLYWKETPGRTAQRFYIAFCLLMSSIQDAFLGLREQELHNLNWSATCSYYSLVHGGRLLAFLALGDFPTKHSDLRRLLSPNAQPRPESHRPANRVRFDWFRKFTGERAIPAPPDTTPNPAEARSLIIEYLAEMGVADAQAHLDDFDRVLEAAAPLRNDSNYEALLIAHEAGHTTMTRAFRRLADAMASAAESMRPFVLSAFRGFLDCDPSLDARRSSYKAFFSDYLHNRILGPISQKLGDSQTLILKLEDIVSELRTGQRDADYGDLEQAVEMNFFDRKRGLMSDFEQKVLQLKRAISR